MFPGEPGDIQDFIVIDVSKHDAVDFQGMETQGNGLPEARQRPMKLSLPVIRR
jgi:hypothetical protein